ncbi:MAG: sugar phosphate isomerase/epimerase [Lentisphaerae bacterium]|nr:sugar phosphate isomerase/epimerase [Lentisphaerota bacterium]
MIKPLSVQLYSLRDFAAVDFWKELEFVAKVGYKGVEPAGFWGIRPSEFRKVLDDLGLKMYSSHSPWARPGNLGEVMDIAYAAGLDRVVCGYAAKDFEDLDAIKRTAETTLKMKEILERNGFTMFQHNHDFEFARLDGRIKYDIYRELCPGMKYELDCFWSTNLGKEDAVEMLELFADDTVLIHMKDGFASQKVSGNDMVNGILERHVELTPLGQGDLPIGKLIEKMPDQVETVIVELDFCCKEMHTALQESYDFMTSNGYGAGNK